MSAATIEATEPMRTRSRQLRKPRRGRPSRGSGRRGAPIGRSTTGIAAPSLRHGAVDPYLGDDCQPQTAALGAQAPTVDTRAGAGARATGSSGWRLTDRGIAVVLIAGAVLLAAAVTVITATAITVTSPDYVQPGQSAIIGR